MTVLADTTLDLARAQFATTSMLAAAGDRTVLLITHRPEGLELVDEMVALNGR
jgi:ABC-type transport system involved in cytochrome bd biosynthesis fused ATPase/permease subunit